ncbi:hypothetical protein TWF694_004693 [Orbilia ellipsospora]|uniref:Protein kinase domain-containing protein n=1 Tax=Orbilia ellipsospora TaxID=2528407 RepID=A0AAV9WVY0_9PEZI
MADQLVLAIVPIVTQAIQSCFQCYSFYTDTKRFHFDAHTLLWKFRLQEARLKAWAKKWGILVDNYAGNETHDIANNPWDEEDLKFVLETFGRIETLLNDYQKINDKYELMLSTEDAVGELVKTNSMKVEDILDNGAFLDHYRKDQELLAKRKRDNGMIKRIKWVASDRAKLEGIVQNLKAYNDGLDHLLSTKARRMAKQALAPELIQQAHSLEDLAELESATSGQTIVLQDAVALRKHFLKISNLDSKDKPEDTMAGSIASLRLPLSSFINVRESQASRGSSNPRSLAVMISTSSGVPASTIIEWRTFALDIPTAVQTAVTTRIKYLAQFLSVPEVASACVPRCLGYIEDDENSRIGLVFECRTPLSASLTTTQEDCISLYRLIARKNKNFLGDRFKLASWLASSLSILHTAGWLHKGLRSNNILFSMGDIARLTNPKLLGFEYSRPNSAYAFSSLLIFSNHEVDLYRHPRVQGSGRERFTKADDIYALGIILLEIGFWRPISELWHKGYKTAEEFRLILCSNYIPQLGSKVGKIYMEVVEWCIDGQETGDGNGQTGTQNDFFWSVVNPLATLVA